MFRFKNTLLAALLMALGLPAHAAPGVPLPSVLISPGGYLYAWGANNVTYGFLGTGDTTDKAQPTLVRAKNPDSLTVGTKPLIDVRFTKVTLGNTVGGSTPYAIGLAGDGSLWQWGYNGYGAATGGTDTSPHLSPALIGNPKQPLRFKDVAAGAWQVKAIKDDGSLVEWGRDYSNSTTLSTIQTVAQSAPNTKWVSVTAGTRYAGALGSTANGNAGYFWGSDVDLEDTPTTSNDSWAMCTLPSAAVGTGAVTTISAIPNLTASGGVSYQAVLSSPARSITLVLDNTGKLYYCGSFPATSASYSYTTAGKVQIGVGYTYKQVAMNDNHCIMAVRSDGTLWVYGGKPGAWCAGTVGATPKPLTQIGALANWAQVAVGADFALMINTAGKLYTMGLNTRGQLGKGVADGTNALGPTAVSLPTPAYPATAANWKWQWVGAAGQSAFAIRR